MYGEPIPQRPTGKMPQNGAVWGALSQFHSKVLQHLRELRQQHPRWGPVSLQLHLEDASDLKGEHLPSPATIGRWLHEDPRNRRLPKQKQPPPQRLEHVRQRWEIDFKVKIQLQGGETVQLHTVTDSFSGAHIGAYLYASDPHTSRVALQEVQATLRACFIEWQTLPEEIQTDGETVLAVRDDLPTDFTLWLAGLGVSQRLCGKTTADRPSGTPAASWPSLSAAAGRVPVRPW